jgi:hypothetical protein
MATGAIMGFASGMIASNGNLHAGLMGALAGAASGAAFGYLGGLNYSGGMFEKAAVEGFAGGALSDVEGGSFKDGFVGAFVGSVSEGLTRRIPGNDDLANTEKVAAAAALGGTASELTGGSFANGAISAAFQHLFNSVADESAKRNRLAKDKAKLDKAVHRYHALIKKEGNTEALRQFSKTKVIFDPGFKAPENQPDAFARGCHNCHYINHSAYSIEADHNEVIISPRAVEFMSNSNNPSYVYFGQKYSPGNNGVLQAVTHEFGHTMPSNAAMHSQFMKESEAGQFVRTVLRDVN